MHALRMERTAFPCCTSQLHCIYTACVSSLSTALPESLLAQRMRESPCASQISKKLIGADARQSTVGGTAVHSAARQPPTATGAPTGPPSAHVRPSHSALTCLRVTHGSTPEVRLAKGSLYLLLNTTLQLEGAVIRGYGVAPVPLSSLTGPAGGGGRRRGRRRGSLLRIEEEEEGGGGGGGVYFTRARRDS